MQLRLPRSAKFSKSTLKFNMYFRPLVKRPQLISTEKMFFFKKGIVGSYSQVKWCLQTKYQLLTRNLKICDGHPTESSQLKLKVGLLSEKIHIFVSASLALKLRIYTRNTPIRRNPSPEFREKNFLTVIFLKF